MLHSSSTTYSVLDILEVNVYFFYCRNEFCAKCNNVSVFTCEAPDGLNLEDAPLRGFESLVDLGKLECLFGKTSISDASVCSADEDICSDGESYVPLSGCVSAPTQASNEVNNGSRTEAISSGGNSDWDARAVLSLILLTISLVCIVIQLILYAVFKQLRNLPGYILINISMSLFVALLFFLISSFGSIAAGSKLCVAMATIQHFAFLASFCWTNIMALDVTWMLRATLQTSSKRKKLIGYTVCAWLVPIAIVSAAIITESLSTDLSPRDSFSPYYGTTSCWFNGMRGLLVFFLLPVAIMILVNVVMYVLAVVAIVEAAKQTKMVNPNLKERLFLAIKLIVVMGLPWIFSFVVVMTNSVIVDYIFIILNASQGVLMFVCFVCTRTVLNLIRSSLHRYSDPPSNRTSMSMTSNRRSNLSISWQRSVQTQASKDSLAKK